MDFKNCKNDQNKSNWSENVKYASDEVLIPKTVHEVQTILKSNRYKSIKVFGTRHCFNEIADCRAYPEGQKLGKTAQLYLENFTWTIFDKTIVKGMESAGEQPIVTFGAGLPYSKLIEAVAAQNLAIINLPSLPHINVVGSMITGTHGQGHNHHILVNYVLSVDIVFPDGTLKTLTRDVTPNFQNYLLNFGGLGVITSMTLRLEPSYMVSKSIYTNLQWDVLFDPKNLDKIMHRHTFFSLFCMWDKREMLSVWVGNKFREGDTIPPKEDNFFGAPHIKTKTINPIPGFDPDHCITPGVGPWNQKIYCFRPDKPASCNGDELQTEYFIPYENFVDAMNELYEVRSKFAHYVLVTECRMVKKDNLPMSPAKGKTCVALHFTWYRKPEEVLVMLPVIENILVKYNAKPHLGKMFVMSGQRFEELYGEDLDMLRCLMVKHDPEGKFRNNFMDKYLLTNKNGKMTEKQLIQLQKEKWPTLSKI